jgi:hypothetical protein
MPDIWHRLALVASFTVLVFLTTLASTAWAEPVKISGTHKEGEIQATCSASGGTFYGKGTGGSGQYYGCVGSAGNVYCSTKGGGTCEGECTKNCASVVKFIGILRAPGSAGRR